MQATYLRNPNLEPLSMDQLTKYAPAIFSKEAHHAVSKRYGFIPTYQILEALHQEGFVPVEVRNYSRADPKALHFTKHMIKFRQQGKMSARVVGDVVPQIVAVNAHDRTSRLYLLGGLYRLVCSNGLLVSQSDIVRPYIVRHTSRVVEEVVDRSREIIKQHKQVFQFVDTMRKTKMQPKQQIAFAREALTLRPDRSGQIKPEALLEPRRPEDNGNNVWSTFNRVQENLTKGGVEGFTPNGRRIVTSEIRGINGDMKINAGVWQLAMQAIARAGRK